MICISTNKLLIITWVAIALLIGGGVGYLLGVKGYGQKIQAPAQLPQQQNFGPGSGGQAPQQGGNIQQPQSQGEAPPGAPGGRNPVPSGGDQWLPQQGQQSQQQGQPIYPNQPR